MLVDGDDGLDPELDPELAAERGARARAEDHVRELSDRLDHLAVEMRDLTRLRDNFHSLYREERELRAAAEQAAEGHRQERDELQHQVILLRADLERVERQVTRLREAPAPAAVAAAPAAPAPPAAEPVAATPVEDGRAGDLERELGLLRAHTAEIELALTQRAAEVAMAGRRMAELEHELADTRSRLAAVEAQPRGDAGPDPELAAATRRIHDLEGEIASLRAEHADLRTAHERVTAARDGLQVQLAAEQGQRAEAERIATAAEQRAAQAAQRENEAAREAQVRGEREQHADLSLQAAKASIGVLEQRAREAEAARVAAEERVAELTHELGDVRAEMLTGHPTTAKRTLLRRRPGAPASAAGAERARHAAHIEAAGTPVGGDAVAEVAGGPEDVESILHRRLFGDS